MVKATWCSGPSWPIWAICIYHKPSNYNEMPHMDAAEILMNSWHWWLTRTNSSQFVIILMVPKPAWPINLFPYPVNLPYWASYPACSHSILLHYLLTREQGYKGSTHWIYVANLSANSFFIGNTCRTLLLVNLEGGGKKHPVTSLVLTLAA